MGEAWNSPAVYMAVLLALAGILAAYGKVLANELRAEMATTRAEMVGKVDVLVSRVDGLNGRVAKGEVERLELRQKHEVTLEALLQFQQETSQATQALLQNMAEYNKERRQ